MLIVCLLTLAGGAIQWLGLIRQSVLILLAAVPFFVVAIFTARRGLPPQAASVSATRIGRFLAVLLGSILLAVAFITIVVLIVARKG